MNLYYLATPYTHEEEEVRAMRYRMAVAMAGFLLKKGVYVYSPIAHSHPIAVRCDLPKGWEFWQKYDECMIDRCDGLLVLKADGWVESRGVQEEIRLAMASGLPVYMIDHPDHESWWTKTRECLL